MANNMVSFRAIADEIDIFDAEVDEINEQRKAFWAELRETLPARDVKALKAAIKARRKRKADKDGEEAYEARVSEILAEIEAGTEVALAHARRANDPPHDPSTGEIIEEPAVAESAPAEVGQGEGPERAAGDEPRLLPSSVAPPISGAAVQVGSETAPVSGDAGEKPAQGAKDASPTIPDPQGCASEDGSPQSSHSVPSSQIISTSDSDLPQARDGRLTEQETDDPVGSEAASADFLIAGKSSDPIAPIPDDLAIPPILKRGGPECVVKARAA